MKTILKQISVVAMMCLCAFTTYAKKSKYISIEATRYEIKFINIYNHTLKIGVKDLNTQKVEFFMLQPGKEKMFEGVYDQERLRDLEVFYTYDFQTFREDLVRLKRKIDKKNYNKLSELKENDWYISVTDFINNKSIKDFLSDFDFDQLALGQKSAEELAIDISEKILKDQSILNSLSANNFASHSPNKSKAAVATILNLAHHSVDFKYSNQIKYLRSMMVLLSDRQFIRKNRNLVYNVADKLDLRTTTPNYIVSLTPIIFTQNLNSYWLAPNEVGLDTEKILSDGWFNNTISIQAAKAITSEMRLGKTTIYSRAYASLMLEKIAYNLNGFAVYLVGEDYVELEPSAPEPNQDITNNDRIHLEVTQFGASGICKVMFGNWAFIDVEGGVLTKQAELKFKMDKEHFENNINVKSFIYDEDLSVLKRSYAPFLKMKLGAGYSSTKGKGIYFSSSFIATQNHLEPNENYGISYKVPKLTNQTILPVPVTSNSWLYSVTFGVDVLF